jgi:poly-gamma-glutamate synthesis protein (capsule biosynthesis protein)
VRFLGRQFVAGERVGLRTEPLKEDVEEIAAVVRSASRLADYTIVSVHAHEGDGDRTVPAQFLVAFAHAMIDAGADVFVGHGPHVLRGIEIYKGRPILYSLGDFIFQNETLLRLPSENYEALGLDATAQVADFNERRYEGDTRGFPADPEIWESVVAVPRWEAERLAALTLHPITLGHGTPPAVRGRPMLATGELACRIIANVAARSRPFGTKVEFQRGVGVVALDATTPTR